MEQPDPEPTPSLTKAQEEALRRAWDILCEHFESCVVAYSTTTRDEPCESVFDCNYHGGFTNAIGLAERMKWHWIRPGAGNEKDHWRE